MACAVIGASAHQPPTAAPVAPPERLRLSAHRVAAGPYAVARGLLRAVVPWAAQERPGVLAPHAFVVAYTDPALARLVPGDPLTLVEQTPTDERTRFFSHHYVRAVSNGIVDLLGDVARSDPTWARRVVVIDDLDQADVVDLEFVALARRRLPGAHWQFRDGTLDRTNPRRHRGGRPDDLVSQAIRGDGRSWTPAQARAYDGCDPDELRSRHDRRADELEASGDVGALIGAIPWHRERGSDPGGAGVAALLRAQDFAAAWGFSASVVDLGMRGRALCDPRTQEREHLLLSGRAANAYVPLGDLGRCEDLFRELLRTSSSAAAHRGSLYGLAMLHTRFLTPRDHERALELLMTARVLAATESDPVERACVEVYEDNGLALVRTHQGELDKALALVSDGITRLDDVLPPDRLVVHRTQLLHNRARVLAAMRHNPEALADFDRLVALDPHYVEYRCDRGNLLHRMGRTEIALEDYDRAIADQPPFAELFVNRADLLLELGRGDEALADLYTAVDLEPQMAGAWVNLGALLLEEDAEAAVRAARAGLDHHPDEAALWCLLGQASVGRGMDSEAGPALDQALALDDGLVPALCERAELHWRRGDPAKATTDMQAALDLAPELDVLRSRAAAFAATASLNASRAREGTRCS